MKKVRFSEQITVFHPVGELNVMIHEPITGEEQLASRNSPFQRKRIKMRALLHLRHLQRKANKDHVCDCGQKSSG